MNHGLSEHTLRAIADVLANIPGIERAVLYGSRAKGTHKPGSDIDLCLVGETLTSEDLGRIDEALDDLLLPYFIDLALLHHIENQELRAHIDRAGVTLYRRPPAQIPRAV